MLLLVCLLLSACAADLGGAPEHRSAAWDGELQVHGALRALIHEGRTGAAVTLDKLLPNPHLYAVGALADLAGEVTIVDGQAHLSYPEGVTGTRTSVTSRSSAGAALLVSAEVRQWRSYVTKRPISFAELDDAVAILAREAGLDPDGRFPFLVEGELEDLRWHVIDGRRLDAGGSSHQDHLAASVQDSAERATAVLVGFYSARDQGVFTHRGARTHIHCVIADPLASGHVDHVALPEGTLIRLPVPRAP